MESTNQTAAHVPASPRGCAPAGPPPRPPVPAPWPAPRRRAGACPRLGPVEHVLVRGGWAGVWVRGREGRPVRPCPPGRLNQLSPPPQKNAHPDVDVSAALHQVLEQLRVPVRGGRVHARVPVLVLRVHVHAALVEELAHALQVPVCACVGCRWMAGWGALRVWVGMRMGGGGESRVSRWWRASRYMDSMRSHQIGRSTHARTARDDPQVAVLRRLNHLVCLFPGVWPPNLVVGMDDALDIIG